MGKLWDPRYSPWASDWCVTPFHACSISTVTSSDTLQRRYAHQYLEVKKNPILSLGWMEKICISDLSRTTICSCSCCDSSQWRKVIPIWFVNAQNTLVCWCLSLDRRRVFVTLSKYFPPLPRFLVLRHHHAQLGKDRHKNTSFRTLWASVSQSVSTDSIS